MVPATDPVRDSRFPGEIISRGVWLYYRFPLSYCDVQELPCELGVTMGAAFSRFYSLTSPFSALMGKES